MILWVGKERTDLPSLKHFLSFTSTMSPSPGFPSILWLYFLSFFYWLLLSSQQLTTGVTRGSVLRALLFSICMHFPDLVWGPQFHFRPDFSQTRGLQIYPHRHLDVWRLLKFKKSSVLHTLPSAPPPRSALPAGFTLSVKGNSIFPMVENNTFKLSFTHFLLLPWFLTQELANHIPLAKSTVSHFCKYSFNGMQGYLFIYACLWPHPVSTAKLNSSNRDCMTWKA